jgi:hypothetical protein
MPELFYEYVSVLAKPQATPLLVKVMQRSQPAKRSLQPLWICDAVVVTGIRWASQSATAIELSQRKWLSLSQSLTEEIWWP